MLMKEEWLVVYNCGRVQDEILKQVSFTKVRILYILYVKVNIIRFWTILNMDHELGCVFPMVIWPAFRMGQYRVNDLPYHGIRVVAPENF